MLRLSPQQIAAPGLALCLTSIGFAASSPTLPACPDNPSMKNADQQANAGCLVVDNGALLVIKDISGRISIPGGSANHGEQAYCTAFRETWEETSVVTVPVAVEMQWSNGFIMFRCDMSGERSQANVSRPLEVRKIIWLEANEFDEYRWRFPTQKDWLKDWLLRQ